MDLWTIFVAVLSVAQPAEVGQWMIIKDAQVGIFNPNLALPIQFCSVRTGGSVIKEQAGKNVFSYERFGTQARNECYGYVVISPKKLSEITGRTSK